MRISKEEIDRLIEAPPILPTSYHLLIRTEEVEKTSEGGIVLMTDTEAGREKLGSAMGYIIAMGNQVWQELGNGERWAELGDKVIFERYAGMIPSVWGLDDGKFRILKDEDVTAICPK